MMLLSGRVLTLPTPVPVEVEGVVDVPVEAGVVDVGLRLPLEEASLTTVLAAGVTAGTDVTDRGKLVLVLGEVVEGSEAGRAAELPVLIAQRP